MGNRSRFTTIAGAAIGVAGIGAVRRARRRARLGQAVEGIADTIMPSAEREVPAASAVPVRDEAHAPGHRHLAFPAEPPEPPAATVGERPFAKHRHGLRHPGRG